eukprot:10707739-Prorocentrum_lima.AAC.1
MMRRVEAQFRGDWTFGYVLWNLRFRTQINLTPNTHMYAVVEDGKKRQMTPEELKDGHNQIYDLAVKG